MDSIYTITCKLLEYKTMLFVPLKSSGYYPYKKHQHQEGSIESYLKSSMETEYRLSTTFNGRKAAQKLKNAFGCFLSTSSGHISEFSISIF